MTRPAPFRRKVFYIPGFDPFPPRRYRELYRSEGARQAAWSGYDLALLPAQTDPRQPYGWRARGQMDGGLCEVDFEVLVWSDIVKSTMSGGILAVYGQLLKTAWIYTASGAIFALVRLRKGPAIAALYPAIYLAAQAALALLATWGAARLLAQVHPAASVLGLMAGYLVLRAGRGLDRRLRASYLMQDFAYAAQDWGAYPPDLAARMHRFAARITDSFDQGYDEVLIVGHSSGAYMAVTILADILRASQPCSAGLPNNAAKPALALLTLGQVVPMVSFLPKAAQLRRDLHDLSMRSDITWVDVSAPGDGCAFALCDPVAVSGVAPAQGQRWPLVISCAFRKTLSAQLWARLRYRFFRLHFQYIYAFDRAGSYDYFAITAGPQTLGQRFGQTAHSKQRMTDARAPYRDMA